MADDVWPPSETVRILVRPEPTDMRKRINGLAIVIEQELELNPLEDGVVFLFCNRQRRILKALLGPDGVLPR